MAEVDTSSYPKPPALPAQKSVLDQVGQYQSLERGSIALGQEKLKQINDQFNIMNAELATLANNPQATKELATTRLLTLSKTFGFKPEVTKHMLDELNAAPDVKTFAENALVRGKSTQEKTNFLYGQPSVYSQGQQDQPVLTSPKFGMRAVGPSYQRQEPPTQVEYDENGQPRYRGPQAPIAPPGVSPGPGLPVTRGASPQAAVSAPSLPIAKPSINLTGPNTDVTGIDVQEAPPATFAQRYSPAGGAAGTTPLFAEGLKSYTADQQTASAKMLAAKPAIQALPLMQTPGFLSGPLTDQFTKAVAGLKSTGLISIADNADPTAIRQEVAKKLYQYVSNSPVGQRSDAAQTLREASSPNPNVQILPALIKLTKDAVALDRIEAAMPNAFKGKDYSTYLKHKGTFPQSVDEKAFILDLETEDKAKGLVDSMAKKLQSKNMRERNDAEKFFKSLRMAKDQGFYQ